MKKKAFLMILDGWGIGDHAKDDVIFILRHLIGTIYWRLILIPNCRLPVKM